MASMRFRRVRAKVSSGIFMMGRMMGNCFRTHHEALFLAKLLLPLLPDSNPMLFYAASDFLFCAPGSARVIVW